MEVRLDEGSQASQNAGESVLLLKLLNMISMAPSNIQLAVSANVRQFEFEFDGGEIFNGRCLLTLL